MRLHDTPSDIREDIGARDLCTVQTIFKVPNLFSERAKFGTGVLHEAGCCEIGIAPLVYQYSVLSNNTGTDGNF